MSKFNVVDKRGSRTVTSPIKSEPVASGVTHEGGPGFARDAKSELFLLAVSNMVGEATFYEPGRERDGRYAELVHQVAVADPVWTLGFLWWLRGDANMRSAALVGAAEAVHARLAAGVTEVPAGAFTMKMGGPIQYGTKAVQPTNRQMIAAVLQRADEPGEFLAYWRNAFGKNLPQPVKRGVADAAVRLFNEFSLLKYDTASHGFRFGDVIDLTHPVAKAPWQGDLFKYALDRRHGRDVDTFGALTMVAANAQLRADVNVFPEYLLDADRLKAAGMTWEDALSLAGNRVDKARLWEALAPSMGYMALLRNLRNFDEAGIGDEATAAVAARLADPVQVARSRQLPMRFLSAYRAVKSLRWGQALETALAHSLANVPALTGRTLILVDVSGSMADPMSGKSELSRADAGKVFAVALALRAEHAALVWFNHQSGQVAVPRGGSLLKLVDAIPKPTGGTQTGLALQRWFDGHDRVVVVTDEQAADHVTAQVPFYTVNLGGYRYGHGPSGTTNRHVIGGLTDACFNWIPLCESGARAAWPWTQ